MGILKKIFIFFCCSMIPFAGPDRGPDQQPNTPDDHNPLPNDSEIIPLAPDAKQAEAFAEQMDTVRLGEQAASLLVIDTTNAALDFENASNALEQAGVTVPSSYALEGVPTENPVIVV